LIFSTILNWHYTIENEFEKGIQKLKDGVIAATLDIFNEAKNKLLPTPTKSHYTFNLRDYARVIQVQISCQVTAYDDVIEIVEYIYIYIYIYTTIRYAKHTSPWILFGVVLLA
jgi:dynein heavy chain